MKMLATIAVADLGEGRKKRETEENSCFQSFAELARRPADKQW